ncbi:TPA: hypothetical protein DIC20_01085 [Candidatus Dependentiae bacterium]|nr:MAG: hypothetical protein US03_C0002G0174 [candidate division TM6 bacterium GW2011_GWF2_36_131]KKQ03607.1 MAG: hypothetical protein US13_C0002G0173 [candidate division TM6 bacterium GW2011_GWE2_36_25]KKQ20116.1 MAG: hypothetical protein US32_C0001G0013 [candidate division TM6 bacterium GW2011_GWA2_36_9]HBR70659.1 hypothetical protein [Candidatus Dependentiae bacterium]HCU00279.1 hypothetical protein [Candidatus Dependentiae bacterium]
MHIHKKTFIFSLFSSLIISICLGFKLFQYEPNIRNLAAKIIYNLMHDSCNCHFIAEIESVNLFTWTITCKNLQVRPLTSKTKKDEWFWSADKLKFAFSPLDFLLSHKLMMSIDVQNVNSYSTLSEEGFPLGNHLNAIFFGQQFKIPIALKSLKMHNMNLKLHNEKNNINSTICWSGTSKKIQDKVKSMFYLNDGSITYQEKKIADHITGTLYMDLARCGSNTLMLDAHTTTTFNNQICFIEGQLHGKKGNVCLWSQDKQALLKIYLDNNIITSEGSLDTVFLKNTLPTFPLSDHITMKTKTTLCDGTSEGEIFSELFPLSGTWHYKNNELSYDITNTKEILITLFSSWFIKKNNARITGIYSSNKKELSFIIPWHHTLSEKEHILTGKFIIEENNFIAHGLFGPYQWHMEGTMHPAFTIKEFICTKKNNPPLATLSLDFQKNYIFNGSIHYQEIKSLLPEPIRAYADGNASFNFKGTTSKDSLTCEIKLNKGTIVFDAIHNMLTQFEGIVKVNFAKKIIKIPKLYTTFNEGTAQLSHAIIRFDQNLKPIFAHLPVTFNKCLISLGKNFVISSGNFLISHQHQHNHIDGNLLLEKAFLYEIPPIPSQKSIFNKPISARLKIETKEAARINTQGFQTHLHANLKINYHKGTTHLDGWIKLPRGTIIMPYSRLNIISGALYFAGEQQFDPLLELTAKTQINQHTITVHATGSIKNPIIRLAAIPSLTEEKIASLLLTGSTKVSLNAIAPTLIIEFIKKQILEHTAPVMQRKSIKSLLKPLKHIKFIPSFTDESGLGGLSGGVELDLGKRLQAKVQKNFNLQDDTEFEINYRISDEFNLQAFKNEQGDIGGQVQMNLKL